KQEEKRIEEEQAASARYWKIPACCDDDDDYDSAITPVLSTEEPVDSLKRGIVSEVDFEKAYDNINWKFLGDIMKRMRFANKWCKWVENYLNSISMLILVNGSQQRSSP
nr:protein kinase-like domain, beta-lactamase/transpeptidase-like protein [Tanacetum cinerariifolium]